MTPYMATTGSEGPAAAAADPQPSPHERKSDAYRNTAV
jgi:hypothetical protein